MGSVGLTLTWFIWDRNLALHITLYSVNSDSVVFFVVEIPVLITMGIACSVLPIGACVQEVVHH